MWLLRFGSHGVESMQMTFRHLNPCAALSFSSPCEFRSVTTECFLRTVDRVGDKHNKFE